MEELKQRICEFKKRNGLHSSDGLDAAAVCVSRSDYNIFDQAMSELFWGNVEQAGTADAADKI
jgi:hypothetical protein